MAPAAVPGLFPWFFHSLRKIYNIHSCLCDNHPHLNNQETLSGKRGLTGKGKSARFLLRLELA
jgi:hypothetical protein